MINKLSIKNWKCHSELDLKFKKGVNFIIGYNGIGKTSILEAIVFSFVGRVRGKQKKQLRKIGSDDDTQILLEFTHEERKHEIKRDFNGKASNNLKIDDPIEEYSSDEILEHILQIYKVNRAFFENIFYSPEGEMYDFLKLDQKNFVEFLQNLVGIGKINEFKNVVNDLNKLYDTKRKETQNYLKVFRKFEISEELGDKIDINQDLKIIIKKLSVNNEITRNLNNELSNLGKENENLYRENYDYSKKLEELKDIFSKEKDTFSKLDLKEFSLKEILNNLNIFYNRDRGLKSNLKNYRDSIKATEDLISEKKASKNEKTRVEVIINKLKHNYEEETQVSCPLCRKNLEKKDYMQIYKNINLEIEELEKWIMKKQIEVKNLRNQRQQTKRSCQINQKIIRLIESIQNFDRDTIKEMDQKNVNLNEKINRIDQELNILNNQKRDLENKEKALNQRLSEIKAAESIKDQLQYKEQHHKNIKGSLICDITNDALSRVMKDQRNFNLDEIIRGIQKIWKIFFPYEDRELLFDDKYLPYFEKGGETITFNNASAGEKMILLILIKIALARKYTAIPFLIFDEPLEHLNYENRINIINYLIDICRKGLVKQLIITTFEESLTRRFRKMEEVNVISLPSYSKY